MALLNSRGQGVRDHPPVTFFLDPNSQLTSQQPPPYALNEAQIGGLPTVTDDVPPLIAFLIMFSASALVSIWLLEHHRRHHGHLSTIAIILFLFAGERVLTCILRLVWAYRLVHVQIALAAQVFVQAGVLLLYLMNLLLVKRIWVEQVPGVKLQDRLKMFLGLLSMCTVSTLIMVITSIIISVYTLDQGIITRCLDIQRAGETYFVLFATVPIPLLLIIQCLSRDRSLRTVDFDPPRIQSYKRRKIAFVCLSTLLCLTNAGFKAGVVWMPVRPLFDPAWYHSRACLYAFVFGTELCVLLMCFVARADLMFELEREKEPGMLILPEPRSCSTVLNESKPSCG